jgi:hypothetical protein
MSLEHLVKKLAAFESQGDLPVVSLYLNAQAGVQPALRHRAGDNSEAEIGRLHFGLEVFSVGDV